MKRVMLIDDSAEIRVSLAGMLQKSNDDLELYLGRSLYDADSYIYDEGISFDLIIVDFFLRSVIDEYKFRNEIDQHYLQKLGATGVYLMGWVWIKRFLREHPDYDPTRVVGLSAYTDLLDLSTFEEAGIRLIDKRERDSAKLIEMIVRKTQPLI